MYDDDPPADAHQERTTRNENLRQMHKDDLKVLLEQAAEQGARNALAEVGMSSHDPEKRARSQQEILDARALGVGVKSMRQDVMSEIRRWIVRIIVVTIIGAIAIKLGIKLPTGFDK